MFDKPDTYPVPCSLGPIQALNVREMIRDRTEFSDIKMDINNNRETYDSLQSQYVPEGNVLVIFHIPCRKTNITDFSGELAKIINQESGTIRGERDQ